MHPDLGCVVQGRQETDAALLECCRSWLQLASSCYGPHGRTKVLQAHDKAGASIITSTSARIAQGVHCPDCFSALLTRSTILAQHAAFGDGGLLSMMIACRLILDALGTASSHACRLELVSGFQTAMQWLCEVEQTGHGHAACSSGAGAGAEKSTHSQARVESGEGKGEGASRRTNTRAASAAGAEAGAGARQGIQAGGAVGTVAAATAVTSGGTGVGTSGSNHAKQPAGAGPALQHQQQQQQQQQQEAAPVALPVMLSTKASGVQAYVAVARAAICAKPATGYLSERSVQQLCRLVVQAFLAALPDDAHLPSSSSVAPPVRVLPLVGLQQSRGFVTPGLLLDIPLSSACQQLLPLGTGHVCNTSNNNTGSNISNTSNTSNSSLSPLLVALFDISLEPSRPLQEGQQPSEGLQGGGGVLGTGAALQLVQLGGEGWSPQDAELQELLHLVHQLHDMGVQVLASQKIIHESVQQAALSLGILPLQRLSILHVHALAAVCGAVPISSVQPSPSWRSFFGLLGSVQLKEVGSRTLIALQPPPGNTTTTTAATPAATAAATAAAPMALRRQQPVHTLVLGCASELHAEELRPAVEAGLRALRCLMASPAVLPGGGCGEVLLAACLRRHLMDVQADASGACGRKLSRLQAAAVQHVAAALEHAAALLVPHDSHAEALEAVQSLAEHVQHQAQQLQHQQQPTHHQGQDHAGSGGKQGTSQDKNRASIDFVGWDSLAGEFLPVATAETTVESWHNPGQGPAMGSAAQAAGALCVTQARLLDVGRVKLGAVLSGIEAACMLLRLDGRMAACQ